VPDATITVLYDADCGFCRWSLAWLLQRDHEQRLVPVAIQSKAGQTLLEAAGVPEDQRLREAHAHRTGDPPAMLRSGGDAAPLVAGALHGVSGRAVAAVMRASPALLRRAIYGQIAANRIGLGRFVSAQRRAAADALLAEHGRRA
jgi:predicted DCC family thiol-disulfide oxidoreductase YuxK